MRLAIAIGLLVVCATVPSTQESRAGAALRASFDEILESHVRDGFVYYRALKSERVRLDAYVASLASVSLDSASRDEQIAFWLNAYNALVLRTVMRRPAVVRNVYSGVRMIGPMRSSSAA